MVTAVRRREVRKAEVVAVLGGSAVLAGSWAVVAVDHGVPRWEERLFETLNGLPEALWPVVWGPMQLGSLFGSAAVVAVVYVTTRERRLTLATFAATQGAWLASKAIKALVSRGRPGAFIADLELREHARGVGYVSGHTAVAFALAAALAPSLPRLGRVVVFGLASIVAFARVYSGAHLPLDAVGGAGLGVLAGTLARWAFGLGGAGLSVEDQP